MKWSAVVAIEIDWSIKKDIILTMIRGSLCCYRYFKPYAAAQTDGNNMWLFY